MKTTKEERVMKLIRWAIRYYGGKVSEYKNVYSQIVNPYFKNPKLSVEERRLLINETKKIVFAAEKA